ncbi:MAG: Ig-like domain-containing protein [Bacteroidales bacterium]|nr:Ig-like domain-containing protein [Bacteroidales bacterium]
MALDRTELSLKPGVEATLTVVFSPADATDIPEVVWESSDNSVATVSEGNVVAVGDGTAVITATAGAFSASCTVTVKSDEPGPDPIPTLPDTPEEPVAKSDPVSFDNCDEITYQTRRSQADGTNCDITREGQKEGTGWFKRTVNKGGAEWVRIVRGADIVNARIFSASRGHLAFWLWLDPDATMEAGGVRRNVADHIRNRFASSTLTDKCRIELSHASAGGDRQRIAWPFRDIANNLQPGWNYIDLAFKDANVSEGYTLNPEGLNWMRIIMDGAAPNWDEYPIGIDDIVVYEDYGEISAGKHYLHYLNDIDGWLAATSPNYHSKVGYNANEKSVGAQFPAADFSILQMSLKTPVNTGATLEKGHLHFKMYISDITALRDQNGQLEIGSAGVFDEEELHWGTNSFLKYCHNGWNDIVLDLNRTGHMGSCDLNAVNWFRFYNKTEGDVLIKFKDIYIYND